MLISFQVNGRTTNKSEKNDKDSKSSKRKRQSRSRSRKRSRSRGKSRRSRSRRRSPRHRRYGGLLCCLVFVYFCGKKCGLLVIICHKAKQLNVSNYSPHVRQARNLLKKFWEEIGLTCELITILLRNWLCFCCTFLFTLNCKQKAHRWNDETLSKI